MEKPHTPDGLLFIKTAKTGENVRTERQRIGRHVYIQTISDKKRQLKIINMRGRNKR